MGDLGSQQNKNIEKPSNPLVRKGSEGFRTFITAKVGILTQMIKRIFSTFSLFSKK